MKQKFLKTSRQGICSSHLTLCLTLSFIFGYCSRTCPDLKITFKEYITWPHYKGWICFSRKRKTYHICNRIYSWFLSILGLLTFKEWVTWPRVNLFLLQNIVFVTTGKRILWWSIIAIESIADLVCSWVIDLQEMGHVAIE